MKAVSGAEVTISDPNPVRRGYLQDTCNQLAVDPGALGDDTFDIVIDAVGYDATRAASSVHARPGGTILHIGLGGGTGGLDVRRLTLQEITFVGTYCYTPTEFGETVEAMEAGRLGALDWYEERSLSDGKAAFDDIRGGLVAAPKIILRPFD